MKQYLEEVKRLQRRAGITEARDEDGNKLDLGDRIIVTYGNKFYGLNGTVEDIISGNVIVSIDDFDGEFSMHSSDVKKIDDGSEEADSFYDDDNYMEEDEKDNDDDWEDDKYEEFSYIADTYENAEIIADYIESELDIETDIDNVTGPAPFYITLFDINSRQMPSVRKKINRMVSNKSLMRFDDEQIQKIIALNTNKSLNKDSVRMRKSNDPDDDYGPVGESESNAMIDPNPMDDVPSVNMEVDDNGNMTIQLSAFFHSKDNGKIALLKDNPALQDVMLKAIQLETQKAFRSAVHGVLGKPYGLK